jgi:hypothetical protein
LTEGSLVRVAARFAIGCNSNTSAFSRKVLADRQGDFREESFGGAEGKSLPRAVKPVLAQEWDDRARERKVQITEITRIVKRAGVERK